MSKLAVANIIFETTESNRIEYTGNNVVRVRANGGMQIPFGTTAQRASPEVGLIRYNTDTNTLETYETAGWLTMPTGQFISAVFGTTNVAFNTANAAFASANNVAPQVTPAYTTANLAYALSNTIYASVNSNWTVTNTVYGVANAAFASANNVAPQVTPAFNTANLAYALANAAYNAQNTDYTSSNAAYTTANVAFNTANAAFASANNVAPQVTPAFNTANLAYSTANAAFAASNAEYTFSNTIYAAVNSAFVTINAVYGSSNSDYTLSNTIYASVNSNWTVTNTVYGVANAAYGAANNVGPQIAPAYNTANAAFAKANTGLANTTATVFLGSANTTTLFNGASSVTRASSLRANRNITGGGDITYDSFANVYWGARFIVIANGRGTNFSLDGYYDINCPTSGTITGVGGATNVTATASGIPLAVWTALYYILPIGSGATSLAANFRVASYTSNVDIPHDWVLICVRNGDDNLAYFNNGVRLSPGSTSRQSAMSASLGASGVILENRQSVEANYTMTTNYNGHSAGPITINTGVSVTIPTGSNWVIV